MDIDSYKAEIITTIPKGYHISPVYDEESGDIYGWVVLDEKNKEITTVIESIEERKNWQNYIR